MNFYTACQLYAVLPGSLGVGSYRLGGVLELDLGRFAQLGHLRGPAIVFGPAASAAEER